MANMSERCLLCLGPHDSINVLSYLDGKTKLWSVLNWISGLQYPDSKHMPRCVCEPCFDKARETYLFQQVCYKSLEQILQDAIGISDPKECRPPGLPPRSSPQRATVRPSAQVQPIATAEQAMKTEEPPEVLVEEVVAEEDEEQQEDGADQISIEQNDDLEDDSDSDLSDADSEDMIYSLPVTATLSTPPPQPQQQAPPSLPRAAAAKKSATEESAFSEPKPVPKATKVKKEPKSPRVTHPSSSSSSSYEPLAPVAKGNYGCGHCGQYLETMKKLAQHTINEHPQLPGRVREEGASMRIYMCTKCMKKFESAEYLRVHERTCVDEETLAKPFVCNVCQQRFTFQKEVRDHQRETHDEQKRYPCPQCGMRFTRSSQVTLHMRSHTNEKPFECEVCQARFAKKTNMQRHMSTHKEEAMFVCSVCDKAFKWETSLKVHMNTHSQKRMYKCALCEKDYGSMSGYRKHMSTAHK